MKRRIKKYTVTIEEVVEDPLGIETQEPPALQTREGNGKPAGDLDRPRPGEEWGQWDRRRQRKMQKGATHADH